MKAKNKKSPKSPKKLLDKLLWPILIVQFAAICILGFYTRFTQTQLEELSTLKIGSLIISAVDGLAEEPGVDAPTGNVYVHEARLVLPAQKDTQPKLLYRYTPRDESGLGEEVRLVDKTHFNQAKVPMVNSQNIEQLFSAVPKLQACTRGYQMQFTKRAETDIPLAFEKQLKDGRIIYVYLEDLCSEGRKTIIPYLKQIESY